MARRAIGAPDAAVIEGSILPIRRVVVTRGACAAVVASRSAPRMAGRAIGAAHVAVVKRMALPVRRVVVARRTGTHRRVVIRPRVTGRAIGAADAVVIERGVLPVGRIVVASGTSRVERRTSVIGRLATRMASGAV